MDLTPGTVLDGRFRVERPLAAGGTSRIYMGIPLAGAGMVAVKQVLIDGQGRERHEDYLQFRREFELLRALSHPALPRALAFFEEGGHHYLIEEFVPGRTLEEVLAEKGRLPVDEALGILMPLLDVLAYLHEHKVVYRDLKPSNVLITRAGGVRLIDLGAARRWRPGATKDTVPLGTPGYAPPEAYGRGQTDARSDVFSAGVLLHQMLTGRDPAEGEAWKFEAPDGVPEHVRDAVMRAVALDPEGRYQTVKEMAGRLTGNSASPPLQETDDVGTLCRELDFKGVAYSTRFPARAEVPMGLLGLIGSTVLLPVAAVVGLVPPELALLALGSGYFSLKQGLGWFAKARVRLAVHEDGMRVKSEARTSTLRWTAVERVRVIIQDRSKITQSMDISTMFETVTLEGDRPTLQAVLHEVVTAANLTETSAPFSWYTFVGTHVRTFERVS